LYSYVASANHSNFIFYSSISNSYIVSGSSSEQTVRLNYGLIRVISTNSSKNTCYYYSSFLLCAYVNNGLQSQIKDSYMYHCNIKDNYATYSVCLRFDYNQHYIKDCNIINNIQSTNYNGIIFNANSAATLMYGCCLINNINKEDNNKYLFFISSGSITIYKCYIDKYSKS
jgi:hypothetical protein